MFLILFIFYGFTRFIEIHHTKYCQSSNKMLTSFSTVAHQLHIPIKVFNDNQTNVILHNKQIQLKYEWDIHKSDIKYWLNVFYSNTIPELNQPIHQLNQIYENLLIIFGDAQYYSQLVKYTYIYPLYHFVYANNSIHPLQVDFFIQDYSQNNTYILILRKNDRYDNILQIQNNTNLLEQLKEFMNLYGNPFQQEYFIMRTLKYLQLNQNIECYIYISYGLHQFKQQQMLIKQIAQSNGINSNKLFIITEPIYLAKKLLQRFLYKNIKEGPFLVQIKFSPFRFELFENKWNQYNIQQWIENKQQLKNYYEYIQSIPYSILSYQIIEIEARQKIYNINQIEYFRNKYDSRQIIIVTLIANCIDSFKLFAKLSMEEEQNVTKFYALNEFRGMKGNQILRTQLDMNGNIIQ